MFYPTSLNNLIESFKKLPGIGEKTAIRLAFSVMNFSMDDALSFSENIVSVKSNIKHCKVCGTLCDDDDVCLICRDNTRNNKVLVVVQDSKDVFLFEKMGVFDGYYHVLGGLISPLDDIGPDDICIKEMVNRIKEGTIAEVILAIKTGIEADTTALYIKRILEGMDVTVTRLASGIPIGADMDYVDSLTLLSALNNRKEVL